MLGDPHDEHAQPFLEHLEELQLQHRADFAASFEKLSGKAVKRQFKHLFKPV